MVDGWLIDLLINNVGVMILLECVIIVDGFEL